MLDLSFQTCPFDLRDYQDLAIVQTKQALGAKEVPVICLPTGTGKSVVNIEFIRQLFLAGANKGKIRKFLVLCPFIEIVNQFEQYCEIFGISPFVEIWTYAYAIRNYKKYDPKSFFGLAVDECFVAGSLVDGVPIEELKIGDLVTAFDPVTNSIAKKPIVRLFKNRATKLIKLNFNDSSSIVCTFNHPIYTNIGWVKASELTSNLTVYKIIDYVKNQDIPMPLVQNRISNRKKINLRSIYECWSRLLQFRLWEKIYRKSKFSQNKSVKFKKSSNYITKDVRSKSDEIRANTAENECFTTSNRSQTKNSRWEWATNTIGRTYVDCSIQTSNQSIRSQHKINTSKIPQCQDTKSLQNRYRVCRSKISNRNRWQQSFKYQKTKTRQEKNVGFTEIRLESFEIYESTDIARFRSVCPDGYVYNFEVADWHTYTVENICVHNCHHSKADELNNVIEHFKAHKWGLSATPDRLDGKPLNPPYTVVIQPHTDQWFEDNGYLAPIEIYHKPLADFTIANADDDLSYQNRLIDKPQIFGDAFKEWDRHCFGMQTIGFLPGVSSGEHFTQQFNEYFRDREKYNGKHPAIFLDAKTPKKFRELVIANLGNLDSEYGYDVLINVGLFIEGLDCPKAQAEIMLRKTMSRGAYKQMIGRIRRPGKTAYLLDHVGNFPIHNHPNFYIQYDLKGKQKANKNNDNDSVLVEIPSCCPKCQDIELVQFTNDLRCLVCGYTFNLKQTKKRGSRALPEQVEGELKKFQDHPGRMAIQKAIEEWNIKGKPRKWKKGWMVHEVKKVFMSYPNMPLELAAMALSYVGYSPNTASIIAQQALIQSQIELDRGVI